MGAGGPRLGRMVGGFATGGLLAGPCGFGTQDFRFLANEDICISPAGERLTYRLSIKYSEICGIPSHPVFDQIGVVIGEHFPVHRFIE